MCLYKMYSGGESGSAKLQASGPGAYDWLYAYTEHMLITGVIDLLHQVGRPT